MVACFNRKRMPLSDATGPGRGARSLYRAANAIGRCDSMRPGGTELKFEDRNKGPRRLLAGDEQDLGEGLRIELNRLVSLFASCRRGHRRTRPRFKRLRRVRRSISEFVTSRPATTISPAPFDGRTGGARPRSRRRLDDLCFAKLRVGDVESGTSSRSAGVGSQVD